MSSCFSSGRGVLESLELRGKAAPGAVEAHAAGDIGAAERPRRIAQREVLPCHQPEHLAVGLAQPRERSSQNIIPPDRRERFVRAMVWSSGVASGRAVMVRERPPRYRVQPRERFSWNLVELA